MRLFTALLVGIFLCTYQEHLTADNLENTAFLQNTSKEIKHNHRSIEWSSLFFERVNNIKLKHSKDVRKIDVMHQISPGTHNIIARIIYSSNISLLAPNEPTWESYFNFPLIAETGETYTLDSHVSDGIATLWVVNSKGDKISKSFQQVLTYAPWSCCKEN